MASVKKWNETIWTEKYRPTAIEHLLVPARIRERFADEQIGANLLFTGTAGIGKTTLSKILSKGRSTMYIDCSTNRGIDVIRGQIIDFASTNSLTNRGKKVIQLDEAEKLTKDAQDSLKATIEQYHSNVWFILTSNHPERFIAPLISRFEVISFNFTEKEEIEQQLQYAKRIRFILQKEGGYAISTEALKYLTKKVYPDMRKIIGLLYQITRTMKPGQEITEANLITSHVGHNEDLYKMLLTEYREEKLYAYIKSTFSGKETQTLASLGEPFLDYLASLEKHKDKVLTAAMISHKYSYEATTGSIDPLIPLLACAAAMSSILK